MRLPHPPKSALDLKRAELRTLLRIYKQSHPQERGQKIRQAMRQMVQTARN
jgi:hypothetical protein